MSLQLFRKHAKRIIDQADIKLPSSEHMKKRFLQTDLFRFFTIPCPVATEAEVDKIKKLVQFRSTVFIKDEYICQKCPLLTKCLHAKGKPNPEDKFNLNQMIFYVKQLYGLEDAVYINILDNRSATTESHNNHFQYWGSALRIVDTLEQIIQDEKLNKGEINSEYIKINEEFDVVDNKKKELHQQVKEEKGESQDKRVKKERKPSRKDETSYQADGPIKEYKASHTEGYKKPYDRDNRNRDVEKKPYQDRQYKSDYSRIEGNRDFQKQYTTNSSNYNEDNKDEGRKQRYERPQSQTRDYDNRKKYNNSEDRGEYRGKSYQRRDNDEYKPRKEYGDRTEGYNRQNNDRGGDYKPRKQYGDRTDSYSSNVDKGGDFKKKYDKRKETEGSGSDQESFNNFQQEQVKHKQQATEPLKKITPDDMLLREPDTKKEGGRKINRSSFSFTKTVQ